MYLLSANGTLRTILVLLIIWQVLRLWMRVRQKNAQRNERQRRWTGEETRRKGDVRIEKLEDIQHGPPPSDAEDADFEEIKD